MLQTQKHTIPQIETFDEYASHVTSETIDRPVRFDVSTMMTMKITASLLPGGWLLFRAPCCRHFEGRRCSLDPE
jgi:hypothetical protein